MQDAIVVGAGPAGLTVAARLAAAGHDVTVLEEHAEVGWPVHCTGLLGLEAFRRFELPSELILTTIGRAAFFGPRVPAVVVESPRLTAAVVDRPKLDTFLARRACVAGARLETGRRVTHIHVREHCVEVHIEREASPRVARSCVVASGASYRLHRSLGLGVPRAFLQSAQVECVADVTRQLQVLLGRAIAPDGFAWIVPVRRDDRQSLRVGLMCKSAVRSRFDRLLSTAGIPPQKPRIKLIPLGPVSRTYAPRLVAVGDAAGLVKPTTGGGIYYSMISGTLAADVLSHALVNGDLSATRLREYETRWKGEIGAEIRIGLAFRRLMCAMNDDAIDSTLDLARRDGIIPLLTRTANFDWHRTAAVALLRHRGFRSILLRALCS